MNPLQTEIRGFLVSSFGQRVAECGDTDSLLENGIIDSIGVLELVSYIEQRFGVTVTESEMMPENFDSVSAIAAFLARRLNVVIH